MKLLKTVRLSAILTLIVSMPSLQANPAINTPLGFMAIVYGMHTFAQENKWPLSSLISLIKSFIFFYAGYQLLPKNNDDLKALAAHINTLTTAAFATIATFASTSKQNGGSNELEPVGGPTRLSTQHN